MLNQDLEVFLDEDKKGFLKFLNVIYSNCKFIVTDEENEAIDFYSEQGYEFQCAIPLSSWQKITYYLQIYKSSKKNETI